MTHAIPLQSKRDYETSNAKPRTHSNKAANYSGKYYNVGVGKKERNVITEFTYTASARPPNGRMILISVPHTQPLYTDTDIVQQWFDH